MPKSFGVLPGVLAMLFLLGCCQTAVLAADNPNGALPMVKLAGGVSDATVSFSIINARNGSPLTRVETGVPVAITATIKVAPEDAGWPVDIFVLQRLGKRITYKNSEGDFVPWDLKLSGLEPFLKSRPVSESISITLLDGAFESPGALRLYVAYRPAGTTNLVFNAQAARFDIVGESLVEEPAEDEPGNPDQHDEPDNAGDLTSQEPGEPFEFFESSVADDIIGAKCVVCHATGGVADGQTALLYERDADLTQENFDIFAGFFAERGSDAVDYILSKASGGDAHTGGNQLPVGSVDYENLKQFLQFLDGNDEIISDTGVSGDDFFNAIMLESRQQTLRRASLLLAGRLPTETEKSGVRTESGLRKTLKNLMQGESFHEFIKDGANDRLLLRAENLGQILSDGTEQYPVYANKVFELSEAEFEDPYFGEDRNRYVTRVEYGMRESPLELIAHVIENDLPYTEILTADYAMFNQFANEAVGGTAVFPENAHPILDFQPGRMEGYYRRDDSFITEEVVFIGRRVIDAGNLATDIPHAGVLNTLSYLDRYPTTATNRNRARARWTYYHFLGVDIEASAKRTTDPDALADTDNPTMKNPNCTICHARLDPMAGVFQNYGLEGRYRESYLGLDSLDGFYKYPEEGGSLYVDGDTWYRDMRDPGFNGDVAPDADNSVQWLAGEIANDPRFATAAVKFWWPALFNQELVEQPEVESDADYNARLMAFEAQNDSINAFAGHFKSKGMKARELFVEMLMSPWFRAGAVDPDLLTPEMDKAHEISGLGNENLLTPEQLSRKTRAITGFDWLSQVEFRLDGYTNGLMDNYYLYYGGIDSQGITSRNREMTTLMSNVAMAHAVQSACPIVLKEFILSDDERKLFAGLDEFLTPLTEAGTYADVTSENREDLQTIRFSAELDVGSKYITIGYLNGFCERDEDGDCILGRNVFIDYLVVHDPNGNTTTIEGNRVAKTDGSNGPSGNDNWGLWWNADIAYRYEARQAGTYTVYVNLSAQQAGDEFPLLTIGIETAETALESNAAGARLIKQKLVELHEKLLGKLYSVDDPEIESAYALFIQAWGDTQQAESRGNIVWNDLTDCQWQSDINFVDDTGFAGDPYISVKDPDYGWEGLWWNWDEIGPFFGGFGRDPKEIKSAWVTVMAYLLSHYQYLYE